MIVRGPMIVSTVAWAVGEALMRRSLTLDRWARAIWTAAVVLALVHVVLAFHLVYGWSHAAAVEATARQTAERFGWAWRGGVFVNYAFLALWLADVAWWWLAPASHSSRSIRLERTRLAVFAFLFGNAAIVFASGAGRLVGIASMSVALLGSLGRRTDLRRA